MEIFLNIIFLKIYKKWFIFSLFIT